MAKHNFMTKEKFYDLYSVEFTRDSVKVFRNDNKKVVYELENMTGDTQKDLNQIYFNLNIVNYENANK